MINRLINELVAYGIREHLVDEDDRVFVTNNLLDLFKQVEFDKEEIKEAIKEADKQPKQKVSFFLETMFEEPTNVIKEQIEHFKAKENK